MFDVVSRRELFGGSALDEALGEVGGAARELEDAEADEDVLPADDAMGSVLGERAAQEVGNGIARGQGEDVAGRALQHGDVRGGRGHGGHEGDGGGSAADDDDALAGVVEIFGPVLRVDELSAELVAAGEVGLVSGVVTVVAGASVEEVAGVFDVAVVGLGGDVPARFVGRPVGGGDAVIEANVLVDAEHACGFADVVEDGRAVGNGLGFFPRAKRVAEGEHVGVGADAGVAEDVPGAADGGAGFEDGVGLAGAAGLQAVGGSDAGEAGAHDDDIEVLDGHGGNLQEEVDSG